MKSDARHTVSSYIDELQSQGQYCFSRTEIGALLQQKSPALSVALHRLSKKGRVARVRGDFFIIVPLEYRALGSLPASWFIEPLMSHLQADYYVGLLSAAALYGATHQQVMAFQVVVNKKIRPIQIGKVRCEFHYQKSLPTKYIKEVSTETGVMKLSAPEVVACDLIRYIEAAGQIHNVSTVLTEMDEVIGINTLIAYLTDHKVQTAHVQRLGYMMDALDLNLDTEPLHRWLSQKNCEYRPLTMNSNSAVLEKDLRWHILVNELLETDL